MRLSLLFIALTPFTVYAQSNLDVTREAIVSGLGVPFEYTISTLQNGEQRVLGRRNGYNTILEIIGPANDVREVTISYILGTSRADNIENVTLITMLGALIFDSTELIEWVTESMSFLADNGHEIRTRMYGDILVKLRNLTNVTGPFMLTITKMVSR